MIALLAAGILMAAEQAAPHDHDHGPRLGRLSFESSCTPAAQTPLVEGLEWLHSFEYARAERQFSAAAAADPNCGIAHWGVAMTYYHPLWAAPTPVELEKGTAAIDAARRTGAASERERDYIAALETFYRGAPSVDHRSRVLAYNAAMGALHRKYPGDHEAAVFYALSLIAAGTLDDDRTFAREKEAAGILNEVLATEPDHPGVAHYLIHSFDYPPLATLALPAARRYAGIAPDSAHAQHMPSHIFTRLGFWDESIRSNCAAEAAAISWARATGLSGAWDQQLHAMDYLAYAYLQTGRDKELDALVERLAAIRQASPPSPTAAYAVTAIPARAVLERHRWSEAAELDLLAGNKSLVALSDHKWAMGNILFARAVGSARSGDVTAARREIGALSSLEQSLTIAPGEYDWRKQLSIQRQVAEAWLARAERHDADAEKIMRAAADLDDATEKHPVTPGAILPAREQLGELLLVRQRPGDALREFRASLERAPERLSGMLGADRAARAAGQADAARSYYAEIIAATKASGGRRSEVAEAQAFAAQAAAR
jgi:hypothetical protein